MTLRKHWLYSVSINTSSYTIVLTRMVAYMIQTFFRVAPSCRACQYLIQCLTLCFAFIYINIDSRYMVTWYVDNVNFNELPWIYYYFHWKSNLLTKILYYEPCGNRWTHHAWSQLGSRDKSTWRKRGQPTRDQRSKSRWSKVVQLVTIGTITIFGAWKFALPTLLAPLLL